MAYETKEDYWAKHGPCPDSGKDITPKYRLATDFKLARMYGKLPPVSIINE